MRHYLLTAVIALIAGFGGAALWSASGLGHDGTRAYLLDNPQILPDMAANYEAAQTRERLAEAGGDVAQPFPGAVLGNPEGSVTLVEFTDYGCGFCRMSREHVDTLIAANPDLRVVIREWPIFEGSDAAARMALAAAQQGKFGAFHRAMFAQGSPSEAGIEAAARIAGIDMAKAQPMLNAPAVEAEIARNGDLARQLGFGGTPSWIVGDRTIEGAVGVEGLQEAIDAARAS
ncbi:MAG: DsbA family protein [Pontixanthobacter sp.]